MDGLHHPRKGKRTSKACDACHQRKAKCYWRPPSCVDCIRLGLECTFNRSNQESNNQEVNNASQSQAVPESEQDPPATPIEQAMNNNIEEMVVFKYFAIENHIFPIFSFASFHNRLRMHHAGTETRDDPAWLAGLHGLLAACGPHLQLAEADFNEATAKQHLHTALSYTNKIMLQPPTTMGVQALTCIVACLRHPVFSDISSINLLAVAIRMAYSLHLHRLDEIMEISPADRLERLRLFWCLYILDKEIALQSDAPPLIDDDNIRVIDPRMFSEDELGLVQSSDKSVVLNMFTARQRLARIASKIWKELRTFKAQHRPKREVLELTMRLNEELVQWKREWFKFGSATDVAARWPENTTENLANLQCRYFQCLLKRNIDLPSKAVEMRDYLKAGMETEYRALNVCCVIAARDTLHLTRAVRKGGLLYIFAAMTYTVPGIVMMLFFLCSTTQSESQRAPDMEIVKDWLDIQGYLVERMDQPDLSAEYTACQDMYAMAEARVSGGN